MGDVLGTSSTSWKRETFNKLLPGITEKLAQTYIQFAQKASNLVIPEFYKTHQTKEYPATHGCSLNGWGVRMDV